MKGRIVISTGDGEKILLRTDEIKTVIENKSTGHTEIHMCEKECEDHFMTEIYITNESFDGIFKKIIDASAKEQNRAEEAWAIMRLLFKAMNENGDATATQEQMPETDWIPAEERLPDYSGYYLCTHYGRVSMIRFESYFKKFGYWEDNITQDREWNEIEGVTHWMPLPEPPEGV